MIPVSAIKVGNRRFNLNAIATVDEERIVGEVTILTVIIAFTSRSSNLNWSLLTGTEAETFLKLYDKYNRTASE